jgi:hypothetical protein
MKLYPYVGDAVLLASAQEVTASYVDLGGEINAKSANKIHLLVNQNFTDSATVTFQCLLKRIDPKSGATVSADEYSLLNNTLTGASGAGTLTLETGRVVQTNADQKYVVTFDIPVGFVVQIQVLATSIDGSDDELTVYYQLAYENN